MPVLILGSIILFAVGGGKGGSLGGKGGSLGGSLGSKRGSLGGKGSSKLLFCIIY